MSVATWSLRLRPVCRRAPGVPMLRVRAPSTAMWMSSSLTSQAKSPLAIWPEMSARPASMACWSASEMMPCSASILAWARLPAMSCCAMALSTSRDAPNSCVKASTPFSNLPPQRAIGPSVPLVIVVPARLAHARKRGRPRATDGPICSEVPPAATPCGSYSTGWRPEPGPWTRDQVLDCRP